MSVWSLEYLEKVYSASNLGELREGHAEWACQYDRDVMMGYQAPDLVAARGRTGM